MPLFDLQHLRDGVGDGQIPYVMEHEITAIQNCFRAAGLTDDQLLFTYIIVSKRINTRFFKMTGKPVSKIRAVAGPKKIQRCWM